MPSLACLALACLLASGDENKQPFGGKEPTGGLLNVALRATDLGDDWMREIKLLFDPQARPPEIFLVPTNHLERAQFSAEQTEKWVAERNKNNRAFFSRGLANLGAEAQMILEYYDSKHNRRFSMFLYRYKTTENLNSMWKDRREIHYYNMTNVAGEEVIYTTAGKVFLGGVKASDPASDPSVERRDGRFHIMVSPGNPDWDDPGLSLIWKQVDKVRKYTERDEAPSEGAAKPSESRDRSQGGRHR